jgi:hypothetical protein
VRFATILAGYDFEGAPANADASIGTVTVGKGWMASSIVAGAVDMGEPGFGIGDNLQTGGDNALIARIASITIKGNVTGSLTSEDHFGFVAQQIDKLQVAGTHVVLRPGPSNDNLPFPSVVDVRLLEVLLPN